jgi:hypothetical protein
MRPILVYALLPLILAAAPAQAEQMFTGAFSGEQETVDTPSPGTGNGFVTLSDDRLTLEVSLDFGGLLAPAADAHIHCCAPLGDDPMVNNGPVAIGFTPAGFPVGQTAGSFTASFDLTLDAVYGGAFLAAHGGTAEGARAALISGLEAGLAYLNIHTPLYPAGEIRAQLSAADVPEPATVGLLGLGLLALAGRRRR